MKHFLQILLIAILLPGIPAHAGWLESCQTAYRNFVSNPIAQLETKIAELESQYETFLIDEAYGHDLASVQKQIAKLWNQRAQLKKGYATVTMREKYLGEHWGKTANGPRLKVRYFSPEERAKLEIKVDEQGLFRSADGSLLDSCVRTLGAPKNCEPGIFVMDAEGRIYFYSGPMNRHAEQAVHHSSFLSGLPVASAGMLEFRQGRLISVNSTSGHYRPTRAFFEQVFTELEKRGVKNAKRRLVITVW
ncbi:MAG: hypothetical protein AB7K68_03820 [Bacteriovoracia bacterium]